MTLPMIGKPLGHTQVQTTQRYAHLLDDPLRAGLEQAGEAEADAGLLTFMLDIDQFAFAAWPQRRHQPAAHS